MAGQKNEAAHMKGMCKRIEWVVEELMETTCHSIYVRSMPRAIARGSVRMCGTMQGSPTKNRPLRPLVFWGAM